MMEDEKGVSSLNVGKGKRHGLRGLSRGRGERKKMVILELERREKRERGFGEKS